MVHLMRADACFINQPKQTSPTVRQHEMELSVQKNLRSFVR